MMIALSIAASATAIIFLFYNNRFGIKYLIAVKGVIDAGWSAVVAGFLNLPRFVGGVVPLLLLPKIFLAAGNKAFSLPLSKLAFIYLISCLWGFLIVLSHGKMILGVDYLLRFLNGYLAFFMFQTFFHEWDEFKKFLIALLISGLFPMGIGSYSAITGQIWGEVRMAAGLIRNVAVYHDAVAIRMYAFLTLTGILLFGQYVNTKKYQKLLLIAYAFVCCIVIYKTYSKSAVLIFSTWIGLWSIFNKKYFGVLIVVLLVGINYAFENLFFRETLQVFSKETAAWSGEIDKRFRFSGRIIYWEYLLMEWKHLSMFSKVFGGELRNAHNEYLRVLFANGMIGLIVYIVMCIIIGVRVLNNAFKDPSPLNVMAIMVFAMLMIDNIGIQTGLYPVYQWQVWGIIGLSLHGLSKMPEKAEKLSEYSSIVDQELVCQKNSIGKLCMNEKVIKKAVKECRIQDKVQRRF